MPGPLTIPVLYGTEREGRESLRAALWMHRLLASRSGVTTTLIDPADHAWLGNLRYREWEFPEPPPAVVELTRLFAASDAFVIVAPEYNHGYPGAIKNLLDTWYDEWNRKPFGIVSVSNGSFGGIRCAEQLRLVVAGVGAIGIPTALPVPRVTQAFSEDGAPADAAWERRGARFLDELEWYARALQGARSE